MIRVFVDGGRNRVVTVWAAVVSDETGLHARVETTPTVDGLTTGSAELEAVRLGADLLRGRPDPRQLWSDSEYALKAAQPHLSGWRPRADREHVARTTAALRASGVTATIHVRSHLKRRYDLPDFFPHELADRFVADKVAGEFRVSQGPVHADCVVCAKFPCREDRIEALRTGIVDAYPEPCDERTAWPDFVARSIVDERDVARPFRV